MRAAHRTCSRTRVGNSTIEGSKQSATTWHERCDLSQGAEKSAAIMGFGIGIIEILNRERSYRGLGEDVLLIGRQTIYCPPRRHWRNVLHSELMSAICV